MKSAVPLTGPPLSKREFAVRARTVIRGALDRLVADDVPLEEFYISKSIKRDYKDTCLRKVLANKINARIDSGEMVREPIVSGDRLSYVVIRNSSSKKLMDKVEDPEWFRQHPKLELDKAYYVKNQIVRPMNQLLSAFGTHIDDLAEMALAEIECKRLRVKPLRKIATKVTPPPPKLVEKKRKVEVVHNTISRYYRGKMGRRSPRRRRRRRRRQGRKRSSTSLATSRACGSQSKNFSENIYIFFCFRKKTKGIEETGNLWSLLACILACNLSTLARILACNPSTLALHRGLCAFYASGGPSSLTEYRPLQTPCARGTRTATKNR